MAPHTAPARLRTFALGSVGACILGLLLCGLGYLTSPEQFYRSYLWIFVYFWGASLGCLGVLMIHHLVGGRWGYASRRVLEAGATPLLIMPILALPILAGAETLYPWAAAEQHEHSEALMPDGELPEDGIKLAAANTNLTGVELAGVQPGSDEFPGNTAGEAIDFKHLYLDLPFFRSRAAIYLGIWAVLALLLGRWSLRADQPQHVESASGRMKVLSGPGLVLYFLTLTFASVDWMMSLDPHWFSAVYGILVMAGQGVMAFSIAILGTVWISRNPSGEVLKADHFHDLGKLLLAAISFWMYISFCQFLIMWSGNLPEEIPWYIRRSEHGWTTVAQILVIAHFILPFSFLLSRDLKRNPVSLAAIAGWAILLHLLDVYWLIVPEYPGSALRLHWLDLAALLAVGGACLALGCWRFNAHPQLAKLSYAKLESAHG